MSYNSSWLFAIVLKIFPAIEACLEGNVTKFQTGTMLTSQVMDSQIHAIEKAIRLLFADPVTFTAKVKYTKPHTYMYGGMNAIIQV